MSASLVDQYRELCQDCRTREAHAWVVPGVSFVWTATLWASIEAASEIGAVTASFLCALVQSAFIFLFVRWSTYQKKAQEAIEKLLRHPEFSGFAQVK